MSTAVSRLSFTFSHNWSVPVFVYLSLYCALFCVPIFHSSFRLVGTCLSFFHITIMYCSCLFFFIYFVCGSEGAPYQPYSPNRESNGSVIL